jgi:hypothetical protein
VNARAQLSLELLVYVALAGLSFALAIGAVSKAWTSLGKSAYAFELSQFADAINAALLSSGSFSETLYLPPGLCGAASHRNTLETEYGSIYFVYAINASPQVFCPDGEYAQISVLVKGGTAYFGGG